MSEYAKKFKDPRWQKKRLEVLEEREWCCEQCETKDKTLHVHHSVYFKGKDPWDYHEGYLKVLCETCHSEIHKIKEKIDVVVGDLNIDTMLRVLGYSIANLDGPFESTAETDEELLGMADYFRTTQKSLKYMRDNDFKKMAPIYRQVIYLEGDD